MIKKKRKFRGPRAKLVYSYDCVIKNELEKKMNFKKSVANMDYLNFYGRDKAIFKLIKLTVKPITKKGLIYITASEHRRMVGERSYGLFYFNLF